MGKLNDVLNLSIPCMKAINILREKNDLLDANLLNYLY